MDARFGVGHLLHLDFKLSLPKDPALNIRDTLNPSMAEKKHASPEKKDSSAHEIWPKKRTAMNGFYHSPLPHHFGSYVFYAFFFHSDAGKKKSAISSYPKRGLEGNLGCLKFSGLPFREAPY